MLPDNWTANASQVIWFSHDDGRQMIFIPFPDGRRLRIISDPNKYQGTEATMLSRGESSYAVIAAYLKEHANCWRVHQCRISPDDPVPDYMWPNIP